MKPDNEAKTGKRIFAILLMSTLAYTAAAVPAFAADKKSGARISINLTNGQVVEGELFAVKGQSFIVADPVAMSSTEVAAGEIVRIRIIRKSKFFSGLGIGVLTGAASGVLLGILSGDDTEGWFRWTAEQKAGVGALALGLIGAPVGAGAASGA